MGLGYKLLPHLHHFKVVPPEVLKRKWELFGLHPLVTEEVGRDELHAAQQLNGLHAEVGSKESFVLENCVVGALQQVLAAEREGVLYLFEANLFGQETDN